VPASASALVSGDAFDAPSIATASNCAIAAAALTYCQRAAWRPSRISPGALGGLSVPSWLEGRPRRGEVVAESGVVIHCHLNLLRRVFMNRQACPLLGKPDIEPAIAEHRV